MKKQPEYTNGPWQSSGFGSVHQVNGPTIADIVYDPYNNASLVAAAPELFEACTEALDQLLNNLGDLNDHFEIKHTKAVIDTLDQAVRKARGI